MDIKVYPAAVTFLVTEPVDDDHFVTHAVPDAKMREFMSKVMDLPDAKEIQHVPITGLWAVTFHFKEGVRLTVLIKMLTRRLKRLAEEYMEPVQGDPQTRWDKRVIIVSR
jgi:hypothetical protein